MGCFPSKKGRDESWPFENLSITKELERPCSNKKVEKGKAKKKPPQHHTYICMSSTDESKYVVKSYPFSLEGACTTDEECTTMQNQLDFMLDHSSDVLMNYIEIVDVAERDMAFVVMECMEANLVTNRPASIENIQALLTDVLVGLRALAEARVFHLNLKPSNVFIGAAGRWVLSDFGMLQTQQFVPEMDDVTVTNCPPEMRDHLRAGVMADSDSIDKEKVDVWAFGCIAYYAAFGRFPYVAGTPDDLLSSYDKPVDFSARDDLSSHFRNLVSAALSLSPKDRPSLRDLFNSPFLNTMGFLSKLEESNTPNYHAPLIRISVQNGGTGDSVRNASIASSFRNESFVSGGAGGSFGKLVDVLDESKRMSMSVGANGGSMSLTRGASHVSLGSQSRLKSPTVGNLNLTSLTCNRCSRELRRTAFKCNECQYFMCLRCHGSGAASEHAHPLVSAVIEAIATTGFGVSKFGESIKSTNSLHASTSALNNSGSKGARSFLMINTECIPQRYAEIVEMEEDLPAGALTNGVKYNDKRRRLSTQPSAITVDSSFRKSAMTKKKLVLPTETEDDMTAEEAVEECERAGGGSLLLFRMQLTEVPNSVMSMTVLERITTLDLSTNQLTSIPKDIKLMGSLEKIVLGENKIKSLPEEIGELTQLKYLDVNHNELTDLPPSLMFNDALETLAMDYNAFVQFPGVLVDIPWVKTIYMAGNLHIKEWPNLEVLKAFPKLHLGLDNEPHLFEVWTSKYNEALPHVTVMWNKVFPDKINDEGLYIGSLRSAQTDAVYKALGITSVLTVGRGLDPKVFGDMKHLSIMVDDIEGADMEKNFDEGSDFIQDCLPGGGCLVHCFAGMSRSSTSCIAFLMSRRGMRLDEAYLAVQKARPAIFPNKSFFNQLLALDAALYPDARPLDIDSLHRDKPPV